jgi:hypothetical protein
MQRGYSSHGKWSTFGELRDIELERGNKFTNVRYPDGTPCIWVCPTKRLALRYAVASSEWDRITDTKQQLTSEEKDIMNYDIREIVFKKSEKVVWKDPEEGFLVCRVGGK